MAESSSGDTDGAISSPQPPSKMAAQMTKIREANIKYKNLLKMAKERIEQQEEELKRLRAEVANGKERTEKGERESSVIPGLDENAEIGDGGELSLSIVRVCQRVKVELEAHELNAKGGNEEIWALIEFEVVDPDQADPLSLSTRRTKKWKKFDSEAELTDFIRRDTGEPISLPPYSLTPIQSAKVQDDAKKTVSKITEDFRRFRVKSEMARKQADAQIRDLQTNNVESAKRLIEGHEASGEKEADTPHSDKSRLERIRAEMARQETQWKEAYDVLLAENTALKSSGAEAVLASQWRQRFETCKKEKEDLEHKLKMERERLEKADAGKYELKYRDLKESFRLYRKKAKEIFEAQQSGQPSAQIMQMSDKSNEHSKLSYLKNLMVNYLTSDLAVREHMEGAIGTVLQFTPEEIAKIEQKKNETNYWGLF